MSGQPAQRRNEDEFDEERRGEKGLVLLPHSRRGAGGGAQARTREADVLVYYESEEDLIEEAFNVFDLPEPELRRAVRRYGLQRTEAAVLKTVNSGGLRSPVGWFFSTLSKGLEWSPAEVELHAQRESRRRSSPTEDSWLDRRREQIEAKERQRLAEEDDDGDQGATAG